MFYGLAADLPRGFARDRLADMTILTTARLELRPITADDLDDLAALYADADVMRYIGTGLPRAREETIGRLHVQTDHWRQHGFGFFMARRRDDGAFVGRCGLQHLGDTGTVEIGYTLAREFWGLGYATEAARACVDYAFGTLGLNRITAIARPENGASRHVMEKLGMRFVKTAKWDGGPVVWYELDRPA
jgi:ribosomal-protein-alanine N-acetyltransferase